MNVTAFFHFFMNFFVSKTAMKNNGISQKKKTTGHDKIFRSYFVIYCKTLHLIMNIY